MSRHSNTPAFTGLEIAVIGMACRFPGAEGVERFWRNLHDGVESISYFSQEELLAAGENPDLVAHPDYVNVGRVIEDDDRFDAALFGFSPREAELIDPQQRMLLECAYQALEHSGYDTERFRGLVGVFAGIKMSTYIWHLYANVDLLATVGDLNAQIANDKDYVATRLAYKLHLGGPTVTVQSACSTSLVGVHLGCQALLSGECDMALAGGVAVRTQQRSGYVYRQGEILSPDGRCRPFDAKAQGTIFGNGLGMVVLKRLEDAIDDGDRIWSVIKGSAVNNDSSVKVGFTAPGADGQERVLRAAQVAADVDPSTINYVEAHGTGTSVGDPIEMSALERVFGSGDDRQDRCAIGSVKSNIGHLATASGVAGLIKVSLALENREIPPSLLFEEPNPQIDFDAGPFFVNTELRPWEPGAAGVRRAGVSAFGIGGTNAHVIVEEAAERGSSGPSRPWQVLPLSAKTETALQTMTDNLAAHLEEHPDLPLADVAFTLQVGRRELEHRRVVVCRDRDEAIRALRERDARHVQTAVKELDEPRLAFMFSGQGSQHAGMLEGLYRREDAFRRHIDQAAAVLSSVLDLDLRDLLFPSADRREEVGERLEQTAFAQPALFALEHALARLWMSWGAEPQAMIGHSIGEYVAACLAGVFGVEDGLRLVAARGRLMQSMPRGSMLAVSLPEAELAPYLGKQLSLAAVNAPERLVVSGPDDAIDALEERLGAEEIGCRRLHTSHAFHSQMMEPILAPFLSEVSKVELAAPSLPYLSNVTGDWITPAQATDPGYWVEHLRGTVRFADGLRVLLEEPERVLLEVGPGQSLTTLARRHPDRRPEHQLLASARHPKANDDDLSFLLSALGRLWLAGTTIDWQSFVREERRHRVVLPTYPFERRRYWVDAPTDMLTALASQATASRRELEDWFHVPYWQPSAMPVAFDPAVHRARDEDQASPFDGPWLVLADAQGLGLALVERLSAAGLSTAVAVPGERFVEREDGIFEVAPTDGDSHDALLGALAERELTPRRIVYLWTLTDPAADREDPRRLEEPAFYALLAFAQALGRAGIGLTGEPVELAVVGNGVHRVRDDDPQTPEKALSLGLCRVLPQEYPVLSARSLDVELPAGADGRTDLADLVIAELGLPVERQLVIAYRGGQRWVQEFAPMRLDRALDERLPLRPGGCYLLTGGLGGVGLALARFLAQEAGARLALLGRSALPPRERWDEIVASRGDDDRDAARIRSVLELEQLGAEVLLVVADVTDASSMERAVAETRERFGAIHGVIHAAGIAGGGVLQLKTPEDAARVLDPKVSGTRHLAAALGDETPDVFVLCSSTIALLGNFGQVDYSSANSFMDAFAHDYRARTGARALSLNWGAWSEVGMAVAAAEGGAASGVRTAPVDDPLHPLIDSLVERAGDCYTYRTVLHPERHWALEEHRISDTAALPGTAHLEMVRAAHEAAVGEGVVELRDVFFLTPVMVPAGEVRELSVVLEEQGDGFRFETTSSGDGSARDHAMGWVGPARGVEPSRLDLDALEERCSKEEIEIGDQLGDRSEKLVYWGPRWQSLQRVHMGEGEALGWLELPAEFSGDLSEHRLHPALLDVATAMGGSLAATAGGESYLPLSYGRLVMHGSLPGAFWCHARTRTGQDPSGETLTVDLTLADGEGEVVVEIEGFSLKRVGGADARLRADDTPAEKKPSVGSDAAGAQLLRGAMSPADGVEAFRRVLSRLDSSQVVISPRDFDALLDQFAASRRKGLEGGETVAGGGGASHPRPHLATELVAPRNRLETILADIWQGVLGLDEVGVEDNFFELGGDSVLGIQVLARAREHGVELTSAQLFEHQTVAELAAALEGAEGVTAADASGGVSVPFALVRGVDEETLDRLRADGAVEDAFPLSPLQEGLLFHALDQPDSGLYVEQVRLVLDEAVDREIMERAWGLVLVAHPSLRTSYVWDGLEEPLQQVHRTASMAVDFHDLSALGDAESGSRADELAAAFAAEPFDLETPPLMRLALLRHGAETTELVWTHHHLLMDGWSSLRLFRQVFEVYRRLAAGADVQVKPGPSFRRYVEWLSRRDLAATEPFWRETLAGFRQPTPVGGDRSADQAAGRPPETVREDRALPASVSAALESLAQGNRVTLNVIAQSVWSLLLSSRSGDRDVVFGASISSRPAELDGVESMIGLFLNALPVRVRVEPEHSLTDWWRQLSQSQVHLLDYAHTPLARVHEWSDVPRDRPLFESMLEVWSVPGLSGSSERGETRVRDFHYGVETHYPLSLRLVPGDHLELQLSWDRRRFDDATARGLLDDLARLLVWVSEHPDARVAEAADELGRGEREKRAERAETLAGVARGKLAGLKKRRRGGDGGEGGKGNDR